jgi:hypothetical protein
MARYMCTYVCIHILTYSYTHSLTCTVHTHTYICMYCNTTKSLSLINHTCIQKHIHSTCTCTDTSTYACIYTHTYTHILTATHSKGPLINPSYLGLSCAIICMSVFMCMYLYVCFEFHYPSLMNSATQCEISFVCMCVCMHACVLTDRIHSAV